MDTDLNKEMQSKEKSIHIFSEELKRFLTGEKREFEFPITRESISKMLNTCYELQNIYIDRQHDPDCSDEDYSNYLQKSDDIGKIIRQMTRSMSEFKTQPKPKKPQKAAEKPREVEEYAPPENLPPQIERPPEKDYDESEHIETAKTVKKSKDSEIERLAEEIVDKDEVEKAHDAVQSQIETFETVSKKEKRISLNDFIEENQKITQDLSEKSESEKKIPPRQIPRPKRPVEEIPDPVIEEKTVSVQTEEPVSQFQQNITVKSEEKQTPELEEPSKLEQIIVAKENYDKDQQSEHDAFDDEELYEEGPLVTEDDDDYNLKEIPIASEKPIIDDNISKEKQLLEEEIQKLYSEVDEDKEVYNVKVASRRQTSKTIKKLASFDMSGIDIAKINMFNFDESGEDLRNEYLKARPSFIAAPHISRTMLLMSGHYEEITAYGNCELLSLGRIMTNSQLDFFDKEIKILRSIYDSVRYVSYSKMKPDFDEWLKHIYYPDSNALYFGVYDANTVGKNRYAFDCPFCDRPIPITIENKDLAIAVDKTFGKEKLDGFISAHDVFKEDMSDLYKWASTKTVRNQLTHTQYLIDYGVPTLYDYLETLACLKAYNTQKNFKIDLSAIDRRNSDDALRILVYMYVKRIGVPQIGEGNKIKFIGITDKTEIINILNSLDIEDYTETFAKKEVVDLLSKKAADYYIPDTKCPHKECGKTIKYISLNPKNSFFTKTGEVVRSMDQVILGQ